MTVTSNGIEARQTGAGQWDIFRIIDGKRDPVPFAQLTNEGDSKWRVTRPGGKGDAEGQIAHLEGSFEEVLARMNGAINKVENDDEGDTLRGYFTASMRHMNVLASKRDQMPFFITALAITLADTLVEDVKPDGLEGVMRVFADRVVDRMTERHMKEAVLGQVKGWLEQMVKEIQAAPKADKPADGETKH